jgi:MFS family permease
MAVGLTISRFFSGRLVDQGKLVPVITWGTALSLLSFLMLAALKLIDNNHIVLIMFYVVSLLMGVGYGLIFPCLQHTFCESCTKQPQSHCKFYLYD